MPEGFDLKWTAVVIAAAVGFIGTVGLFMVSYLMAPKRATAEKAIAYESGIRPGRQPWSEINIRYYLFGLLFLIFDVEAVFLFPWAVTFLKTNSAVFYEMVIFLAILLFGLLYGWRKGALRWK